MVQLAFYYSGHLQYVLKEKRKRFVSDFYVNYNMPNETSD